MPTHFPQHLHGLRRRPGQHLIWRVRRWHSTWPIFTSRGHGRPTKPGFLRNLSSHCRALRPAWIAPVNAVQKIAQLRCPVLYRFARPAHRPDELARFQALEIKRHAHAIMPQNLDQIAPAAPKAKDLARMGIAASPSCTCSASVFMPRLISVMPPAIQTFTPAGKEIIAGLPLPEDGQALRAPRPPAR